MLTGGFKFKSLYVPNRKSMPPTIWSDRIFSAALGIKEGGGYRCRVRDSDRRHQTFRNSLIGHTSGVKPRLSSAKQVTGQRAGRITCLSIGNELHTNASASRSLNSMFDELHRAPRRRDASENAAGYLHRSMSMGGVT